MSYALSLRRLVLGLVSLSTTPEWEKVEDALLSCSEGSLSY